MSAAHTPGPWQTNAQLTESVGGKRIVGIPISGSGVAIARVWVGSESHVSMFNGEAAPERIANARLIAAAPEVTDALEDALILLEGWINRYCHRTHRAEHMADLEKKRAVLAKARGES